MAWCGELVHLLLALGLFMEAKLHSLLKSGHTPLNLTRGAPLLFSANILLLFIWLTTYAAESFTLVLDI
jgi:hypothetical protein